MFSFIAEQDTINPKISQADNSLVYSHPPVNPLALNLVCTAPCKPL
jgi:hypothetical protein